MPAHHVRHLAPPIVEIVGRVDKGVEKVGFGNSAFKAIAGLNSFRNYDWMNAIPYTNTSGNFRGMVTSTRWRTIFAYSDEVGKDLEGIGTFASLAANIAEEGSHFESIWSSPDSPSVKGMKFAAAAGTVANRTLAGVVSGGVHAIYFSLQGYCRMIGLLNSRYQSGGEQCVSTLKRADAYVQTSFHFLSDTRNLSKAINNPGETLMWVIELRFIPR